MLHALAQPVETPALVLPVAPHAIVHVLTQLVDPPALAQLAKVHALLTPPALVIPHAILRALAQLVDPHALALHAKVHVMVPPVKLHASAIPVRSTAPLPAMVTIRSVVCRMVCILSHRAKPVTVLHHQAEQ